MSEVELFFTAYEKTAWAFFSFSGFLFIIYRVHLSVSKIRSDKETRLVNIESRLHHLDNSKDGRVNKLSVLCENQISDNKKALEMASYVKGKLESKSHLQ